MWKNLGSGTMKDKKCEKLEEALAIWVGKLETVQQQIRTKVICKHCTLLLF
jgi:hypothetical protein